MRHSTIIALAFVSSFALATSADAQRGGGLGRGALPMPQVTPNLGASANVGLSQSGSARINREGPANASATGVANANEHAGLSSATTADLTGLSTGLTVKDSAGATIGTVTKVEKSRDGVIHNVLVASADGKRTIRLAPSSLSVSGDVVTTTATPK